MRTSSRTPNSGRRATARHSPEERIGRRFYSPCGAASANVCFDDVECPVTRGRSVRGGSTAVTRHLDESSSDERTNSIQSCPKVSIGCGVRSFPFPQRKSLAAQYLSQPQQMRSGWAGYVGIRRTILYRRSWQRHSVVLESLDRNTCFPYRATLSAGPCPGPVCARRNAGKVVLLPVHCSCDSR